MGAYTCRRGVTFRGLYTRGSAEFPYWWVRMGRAPYYASSWQSLRWSLIESIDGLEFV